MLVIETLVDNGGVTSSHFGVRGLGSPRAPPVPLQAR